MNKILLPVLVFVTAGFLFSCGGDEKDAYPVDKKYWTTEDYHTANNILYTTHFNKKELPNLDNPETAHIFNKLIDTNNVSVVLNDGQLGITHRSAFASDMFTEYKTLNENYSIIDRTDKYQYPVEFAQVMKFGLHLQPYYIAAGNEKIIKSADDPNAPDVVNIVNSNRNILIRNYDVYLDHINYEDRFNDKALSVYAEGLKEYFPKLINQFAPDGDYEEMLGKVENMLKKAKNALILAELINIKGLITSRVKK